MHRFSLLVVMLALGATAWAQESEPVPPPPPPSHEPFTKGTFTVDAMTTPGSHLGFGFYLTNHVSLRPMLGFGYSDLGGAFYNVGAELRVETMPTSAWSFYGVASASYRGGQDVAYAGRGGQNLYSQQDGAQYGGGVGVRRRIHERLMVVLDTRYLYSSSADLATATGASSFGQYRIDSRSQVVASLGLSFALN